MPPSSEIVYVPPDHKSGENLFWTPDEERDYCAGCSTPFTLTTRRHHCRSCGDIFCAACLKHTKLIQQNKKPQKICDMCSYTPDTDLVPTNEILRNQITLERLLRIYKAKIKPLEQSFLFNDYIQTPLFDADFDPKGLVTMLGQYSVGKTTFIETLLGREFPGSRVGPEPTTDKFTAVMAGREDKKVPGNVAVVEPSRPFQGLNQFGAGFLNRFEVAEVKVNPKDTHDVFRTASTSASARDDQHAVGGLPTSSLTNASGFGPRVYRPRNSLMPENPLSSQQQQHQQQQQQQQQQYYSKSAQRDLSDVQEENTNLLESLTFVDTPGILSGEKQRSERGYEYDRAVEWFANRSDRIVLLFDAYKLDISDEFRRVIELLKVHDDKVIIVLNKADLIDNSELIRAKGALMWALGKVIGSPEVPRVYVGSFWNQPIATAGACNKNLFTQERNSLMEDLRRLPADAATRKINDFIKRVRALRVHINLSDHLRKKLPMLSKRAAAKKFSENLDLHLTELNLPTGDLIERSKFVHFLQSGGLERIPALTQRQIDLLDLTLSRDIPTILSEVAPPTVSAQQPASTSSSSTTPTAGAVGSCSAMPQSPHRDNNMAIPMVSKDGVMERQSFDRGMWIVTPELKAEFENSFFNLRPTGSPLKITQEKFTNYAEKKGCDLTTRTAIWNLSDIDNDKKLDLEEFCLASYFLDQRQRNSQYKLPTTLPFVYYPPSKRKLIGKAGLF